MIFTILINSIPLLVQIRKIRMKRKLKADDLIPQENDYLRDLGSRRSKRTEDVKENDGTLDVDDLEGIFTVIYSVSSSDPYKGFYFVA